MNVSSTKYRLRTVQSLHCIFIPEGGRARVGECSAKSSQRVVQTIQDIEESFVLRSSDNFLLVTAGSQNVEVISGDFELRRWLQTVRTDRGSRKLAH